MDRKKLTRKEIEELRSILDERRPGKRSSPYSSRRYAQWCRLIRQGRPLSDARLLAVRDGARQEMGVRRPVTLVALAQLSSPAVFGFRRPRLLLPEAALGQLTDLDLRLLFLHEMVHVRRQDTRLNLLGRALRQSEVD